MVRPLFEFVCLMCQPWLATASAPPPYSLWQQQLRPPVQIASGLRVEARGSAREQNQEDAFAPAAPPLADLRTLASSASLGREWRLHGNRQLVVSVTPSPEHCAPLLEMDF